MDRDGSNLRQVTKLGGANFAPSWHPDGKRLIFASNIHDPKGRDFDIYLINVDGTGLERITFNDTFDGFPMFSPDGKRLVFASNRNAKAEGETNVFIADWVRVAPASAGLCEALTPRVLSADSPTSSSGPKALVTMGRALRREAGRPVRGHPLRQCASRETNRKAECSPAPSSPGLAHVAPTSSPERVAANGAAPASPRRAVPRDTVFFGPRTKWGCSRTRRHPLALARSRRRFARRQDPRRSDSRATVPGSANPVAS